MATTQEDKPVGDLVRDLGHETADLIRKEIELAKLEISSKVPAVETGLGAIVCAGGILFGGFLMMLAAAALGLDVALARPWLSALVIGVIAAGIGGGALLVGLREMRLEKLTPRRTLTSLRRDGDTVARHAGIH
jgi:hypothetical protein